MSTLDDQGAFLNDCVPVELPCLEHSAPTLVILRPWVMHGSDVSFL